MPSDVYKLVVFDWDGTLIDSIAAIVECTQATLAELGLPGVDDTTVRSAIGLGVRETVDAFYPGCDDATFDRIVEAYRKLWFGSFSREPSLFEGVECLLEELAREGRLMAVATAKSRSGLDLDLERTGVGRYFRASRTADEAPGKPNPAMLTELLEELGVDRSRSLMIGDTVYDLEMGRNAGVAALGVSSGSTCREVLLEARPLDCLDRVTALPAWFDGNPG